MANVAEIIIDTMVNTDEIYRLANVVKQLPPTAVEAVGGFNAALDRVLTLSARDQVKMLDKAILDLLNPAKLTATGVTAELAKINVVKPVAETDTLGRAVLGLVGNGIEAAAGLTAELGHLAFTGTKAAITTLGGTILSLVETGAEAAVGVTKELGHLLFTGTEVAVKALGGTILDLTARAGEAAVGVTKELGHLLFEGTVAALDNLGRKILDLPKDAIAAAAGVRGALDTIGTKLHDGITQIAEWGQNVIDWAKKAAVGIGLVTAALTAVGGVAVKAAADYQTAITQIANNTTMTTADIAQMNATIKQMSVDTSEPLDKLAQGFKYAFDYMGNTADATKVLTEATKSAVSTGSDEIATVQILGKAMHDFHVPASDAAVAMNQLHMAAQQSAVDLPQWVDAAAPAIAQAATFHVSLTDLIGAMTAFTKQGYSVEQAATMMQAIFKGIAEPSSTAKKAIEELSKSSGINLVYDFSAAGLASRGLTGVLADVEKATHGNTQQLLSLIPSIRGARGEITLLGNGYEDYTSALNAQADVVSGKVNPTQDAFARTTQTLGFQWDQLKARFNLAKIALGDELMPVVMRALGWIMDEAPKAHAALVTVFDAFRAGNFSGGIAAAGNFLEPFVDQITAFLPRVLDAMDKVGEALIGWIEPRIPALVEKILGFGMRVADTIIDFLPTLIAAVAHWGEVLVAWVTPKIPPLLDKLLGLGLEVVGFIMGFLPTIERTLLSWGIALGAWVLNVAVPYLSANLPKWLDTLLTFLTDALGLVAIYALKFGAILADWVTTIAVPELIAHLPRIQETITNFITNALPIVAQDAIKIASSLTTWITTDAVPRLIAALPAWLGTLLGFIQDALPIIAATTIRLASQFTTWITQSAIPMLVRALPGWLSTLLNFIDQALPIIGATVLNVAHKMVDWVTQDAIPMLLQHLPLWLQTLAGFINGALPVVFEALRGWRNLLGGFIMDVIPVLQQNLPHWFGAIAGFIVESAQNIITFLTPFARRFYEWITDTAIPGLITGLTALGGIIVTQVVTILPKVVAQLQTWGRAFIAWVAPIPGQLLGGLLDLATRLLGWIGEQAPKLLTKLGEWGQQFVEWIKPYLGPLVEALGGMLDKLLNFIVDHLPEIRDQLLTWADEFVHWIAPQVPHILEELGKLLLKLEGFLLESIPKIEGLLAKWGEEFLVWLNNEHLGNKLLAALGHVGGLIKDWIATEVPILGDALKKLAERFYMWVVEDALPRLPGELLHITEMLGDWVLHHGIPDAIHLMEDLGMKIVRAIADGIYHHAPDVWNALSSVLHGLPVIGGIGGFIGGVTGHAPTSTGNAPLAAPAASINLGPALAPSAVSSSVAPAGGTVIHVNVAGSVTTARGLAEDVRTELLRIQRQGTKLGFVT